MQQFLAYDIECKNTKRHSIKDKRNHKIYVVWAFAPCFIFKANVLLTSTLSSILRVEVLNNSLSQLIVTEFSQCTML